jgi:hypothetical protein
MAMQFHLNRLQHRRATIDGGEDCTVYFCPPSCPSVALMKVVDRKSSVLRSQNLDKGTYTSYSQFKIKIFLDVARCHLVCILTDVSKDCSAYETSGTMYQTTQRLILENLSVERYRCENLLLSISSVLLAKCSVNPSNSIFDFLIARMCDW